MNFAAFVSNKISNSQKGSFSRIVGKIAVAGISVGIFIMVISYAILFGFRETIQQKIFSFGGHIQLSKYDLNTSFQENPIVIQKKFLDLCKSNAGVLKINTFSYKAGLIKTKDEVVGAVLKGVDRQFDPSFFNKNLLSGRFIAFDDSLGSKEVLISKRTANKLQIKENGEVVVYFLQNPPRVRKLRVVGVFETGMEEFDEMFMIGDMQLIRRINDWPDSLAGGYEIMVKDFDKLNQTADFVFENMNYDLGLEKITDKYVAIFDWLSLLDQNVKIFLVLIIVVACFNMASSLFIMIIERTSMIGTLKALGANNFLIIKIFVYNGLKIIFKGLAIGNILALTFCTIQYYFKLIPLDPANYYMNSVPIFWAWDVIVELNILLFFTMALVLLIPTVIVSRISPSKAIKFS